MLLLFYYKLLHWLPITNFTITSFFYPFSLESVVLISVSVVFLTNQSIGTVFLQAINLYQMISFTFKAERSDRTVFALNGKTIEIETLRLLLIAPMKLPTWLKETSHICFNSIRDHIKSYSLSRQHAVVYSIIRIHRSRPIIPILLHFFHRGFVMFCVSLSFPIR